YVLVRSASAMPVRVADLQRALREIDATIAMTEVATIAALETEVTAPQRFRAVLFTALGAIALVLSALGIYGVLADAVTRRTREIGIRLALGERPAGVTRRVVADALRVLSVGALVGLALSMVAGRMLANLLVGVDPSSVQALGVALGVLGCVALAAVYVPARRASRVDP